MNISKHLSLISIIALSVHAAPDAGQITQDIQKQFGTQAPQGGQKLAPSTKQDAKDIDEGKKVLVSGFKVSGNTTVTTEEIMQVLKPFIGKRLSFARLQDTTIAIADLYRDKGYSARAFLPPQEVSGGIVEIIILEGKLSAIEIEAEASKRLSGSIAKSIIQNAHSTGTTLEMSRLERGLMILSDTPGITAASTLVAGESAGDSKVKIKIQDTSLLVGNASYTNTGSKSTGTNQLSLAASVNSPLSIGDQLSLQTMATSGIRYARASYVVPAGYSGVRIGANTSYMKYKVIDGSAQAEGSSKSFGLTSSYPIVRSSSKNTTLNLSYDSKYYLNEASSIVSSKKRADVVNTTLSQSSFDSFGQTTISATMTLGRLDLTGAPTDYTQDQTSKKANGRYTKLTLNASRYQSLTDTTSLNLSANYQKSGKNLDSGEQLYLGGSSGVRAYPNSEAGGDEGFVANAELSQSLPFGTTAAVFYDYGQITQHHTLYPGWQGSSTANNKYALRGYGTSLSYAGGTVSAKATLSWRHTDNPNPILGGYDNDGTKSTPRFWMQLVKVF